MNLPNPLRIPWQYTEPPAKPRASFRWPGGQTLKANRLDSALNWPKGTHDVLTQAFKANLSRFHAWDLSDVGDPKPYILAASVYKRGVAISNSEENSYQSAYEIVFRTDSDFIQDYQDAFVVLDHNIAQLWPKLVPPNAYTCHLDENQKNLSSVAELVKAWHDRSQPSRWLIIGGGILSDAAAFAANLCGSSFAFVPTTLLAMVDASVGGKTGVNFPPFGKNQIGRFAFPTQVEVWTGWLKTLSPRAFRSGISEAIKHALLLGKPDLIDRIAQSSHDLDTKAIILNLPELIAVKSKIIEIDPTENHLRATLNLGHTLAHALEAISQESGEATIDHGEAVALGLAFCLDLSQKVAGLPESQKNFALNALKKSGTLLTRQTLAMYLGESDLKSKAFQKRLIDYIQQDKKNVAGDDRSRWVLLKTLGEPAAKGQDYTVAVSDHLIAKAWTELLERI